jgi:LytS/YehU family sensor histidine kinase
LIDTAVEVEREKDYRNLAIISVIVIIALAAGIYHRFREKKKINAELEERNKLIDAQKKVIEEMNEQLKMKILQSKLNPHFLFNSLNSIQYFIGMNDRKGALVYLTRFASFLRNVLKHGDELSITAAQEAALLEQYLWLEQCRFPDRFEYKVQLNGNGTTQGAGVPPMLVHSLVEDALYLGVLNLGASEKGKLDVLFEVVDGELIVTVADNGLDRDEAITNQQSKGLEPMDGASDILEKRLQLFNRRATKKIEVSYQRNTEPRTGYVNQAKLIVPQPLFHS